MATGKFLCQVPLISCQFQADDNNYQEGSPSLSALIVEQWSILNTFMVSVCGFMICVFSLKRLTKKICIFFPCGVCIFVMCLHADTSIMYSQALGPSTIYFVHCKIQEYRALLHTHRMSECHYYFF